MSLAWGMHRSGDITIPSIFSLCPFGFLPLSSLFYIFILVVSLWFFCFPRKFHYLAFRLLTWSLMTHHLARYQSHRKCSPFCYHWSSLLSVALSFFKLPHFWGPFGPPPEHQLKLSTINSDYQPSQLITASFSLSYISFEVLNTGYWRDNAFVTNYI